MGRIRNHFIKSLVGDKNRAQAVRALSFWRHLNGVIFELFTFLPIWALVIFISRYMHFDSISIILAMTIGTLLSRFTMAWFGSKQKKLLLRSKTIDEIAASLDVDPKQLTEWAELKRLSPSFVLKDAILYDENEFNTAKTLLRASSNPGLIDGLLRPVTAPISTSTVELLRPVDMEVSNTVR